MIEEFAEPAFARHEINHRATRYIGYVCRAEDFVFVLLVTGWTGNSGEWVRLHEADSIAWSYIAEKIPALRDREGDKEGWVLLFAEMGIEVFG